MKNTIQNKIENNIETTFIEVLDESYMHSSGADAQSHFKVTVVSTVFEGLLPLPRHRMINKILHEELNGKIHALALHTLTPEEWFAKGGKSPQSPECMGGGK